MKFNKQRYERLIQSFESWWQGTLERPIIQVTLFDPANKRYTRESVLKACYDFGLGEKEVVKELEGFYDSSKFLGDAFPFFYMRSTGILGIYMGQGYHVDKEAGVLHLMKVENNGLDDLSFSLDMKHPLFLRTERLMNAVQDYFDGAVALGCADLGGVLDILAATRGNEELMYDLFDYPEKVKRLCADIHRGFKQAYELQNDIIDLNKTPGYTCWATMLSRKPYYITQCDFSYMIGTPMFDEFYKPILQSEADFIERTFYHLDGPGQVKHLDSILEIENLNGVQWINGAGSEGLDKWPDIFRKIHASGKLAQVFIFGAKELSYIDAIIEQVGTTKGLCFICMGSMKDEKVFKEYLEKYKVPIAW